MNENTEIGGLVNIPDKSDAERVAAVIKDIDNCLMMIKSKQDYIKEAKKGLKEDYDLTPASIALMIKLYHKQEADKHFQEQDELHILYNTLFPSKDDGDSNE